MEAVFRFIFALGVIFPVCFAECKIPVLLSTWPLGFNDGVTDAENGVTNGTVGTDVMYGEGKPGLGNSSRQFNGGAESYIDLRVYNRSAIWTSNPDPDFSLSLYVFVEDITNGTLFHYTSDDYSDANAHENSDIKQFKVYFEHGQILVDYGVSRTVAIENAVLLTNTWTHFVFSRDKSNVKTSLYINRDPNIKYEGQIEGLQNIYTRFPGYIRVGNSFNTSAAAASGPLIGRLMCLKMFAMRDPTWLCSDTDRNCNTATIGPTTLSSSSATTTPTAATPTATTTTITTKTTASTTTPITTTTTTTTTTQLPPTTTTTMPPTTTTTTMPPSTTTTTLIPTTTTSTIPQTAATVASTQCARFVTRLYNVTLQASTHIFDVLNVLKIQTCTETCVRMYPCQGFAATPINIAGLIECKLSYDVTQTAFSQGSELWELL